jgi:hypothetical protein
MISITGAMIFIGMIHIIADDVVTFKRKLLLHLHTAMAPNIAVPSLGSGTSSRT